MLAADGEIHLDSGRLANVVAEHHSRPQTATLRLSFLRAENGGVVGTAIGKIVSPGSLCDGRLRRGGLSLELERERGLLGQAPPLSETIA